MARRDKGQEDRTQTICLWSLWGNFYLTLEQILDRIVHSYHWEDAASHAILEWSFAFYFFEQ